MTWKLFIDDERDPVKDDWVIARSSQQAIDACISENSIPNEISFDHDLGGDDTSMVFLNWLVSVVLDGAFSIPKGFIYSVHSHNPVGRLNIMKLMDNILFHIS